MKVTYDTGALIAAERNDRRMWALHDGYNAEGMTPLVPAPVLAQAWRGGPRQASLVRLLRPCEIEEMTAMQGRKVGELVGASGLGYLPYGEQWSSYLMRRLAERPANVGFFLRAFTSRG